MIRLKRPFRTLLDSLVVTVMAVAPVGVGLIGNGVSHAASRAPTAARDAVPSQRVEGARKSSAPASARARRLDPADAGVRNPYSPAYGYDYRYGVVPTLDVKKQMDAWAAANPAPSVATGPNTLAYGGGNDGIGVQSGAKVKVYLVFFGTQWGTATTNSKGDLTFSNDAAGGAPAAQEMFKGIGTGGELWTAGLTQWCDGPNVAKGATTCPANANFVPYPSGGVLAGVWYDNSAASPSNATINQLGQEAANAAGHFGNTTAAANRNSYYLILSPHGTDPDNYQGPPVAFCAWHSWTSNSIQGSSIPAAYGDLAFSNQPYNIDLGAGCGAGYLNKPGTLDGYTITMGHEFQEMMSDQNPPGGWMNLQASSPNYGEENGDECAWLAPGTAGGVANVTFATGTFAQQSMWSNDTNSCVMTHPIVTHDVITVNPVSGQTWTVGIAYTLQASGSSSQGKALNWSATGLPSGLTIAASTGLITGVPLAAGSGTATLSATDSTPVSASTSFSWKVNPLLETVTVTNPGSQTATVGIPASLQMAATDSAGKTLTYSASGLPAGLTINASTGLITGTPTTAATSSVTVTATSGPLTSGSTTFSWTVNPASVVGITNGGFETGALTGWTTTGTASVTTSGPHSGTYAAQLGSTLGTNGDSTVAQTFTVPPGYGSASFWYNLTCPDTVAHDWATATLTDKATNAVTTLLAKTCTNGAGWTKVSGPVVPGRTYILSLVSHDDNLLVNPTSTKFDDVALIPNPIVNGGFETGTTSGWTTTGALWSVVSSGAHSGTYALRLGSTSPTSGDSNAAQTFTAAGSDSALALWYNTTCSDTVTNDWSTVTLKDNTANTTSTLLPRTCIGASGWKSLGAVLTPGHSYTLTVTNHDNNTSGTPTSTLLDDVLVY